MVLTEGYGCTALHLRQGYRQILDRFGVPDQKKPASTEMRTYWLYFKVGFDCIISRKSRKLLSLFFYRDKYAGHNGAPVETTQGIRPGDTMKRVIAAYGQPQKKGGGFTTLDSTYVRKWFSYSDGIGFHFGCDDKVDIISIFSAGRRYRRSEELRKSDRTRKSERRVEHP